MCSGQWLSRVVEFSSNHPKIRLSITHSYSCHLTSSSQEPLPPFLIWRVDFVQSGCCNAIVLSLFSFAFAVAALAMTVPLVCPQQPGGGDDDDDKAIPSLTYPPPSISAPAAPSTTNDQSVAANH
ncbi:hypothetical protein JDV02_002510 [Purpureocillium takamizusanense]|uniref:Uncharacterized protein n=1 Tax=Purpureocillium takamizusanense TaxID=2060973 RepID=A0A9Q8QBL5_9HYPO|nr:uncharacterized protein JDV02_002510 [Purpureocillium takamizusanense]UNI16034.1 hypothetical protein JDV02_002510 [Purpureocillium takamizusanense]